MRGRVLLGAFDDIEIAIDFVRRVAITPESTIRDKWPRARNNFLAAPCPSFCTSECLDSSSKSSIQSILEAPLFARTLASKKWCLASIALDSLVISQPMLNLDRLDLLRQRVQQDVIAAFFPVTTAIDVDVKTASGPTVTLTSSRGELTVSDAQLSREPGNGAIDLTLKIEPRPNYVSALDQSGLHVLRNGHHRMAAAWQSGLRSAPCVLVEGSIEDLAERMKTGLPVASFHSRPPLLRDLAEPGSMTIEVDLRTKEHRLEIGVRNEVSYSDQLNSDALVQ